MIRRCVPLLMLSPSLRMGNAVAMRLSFSLARQALAFNNALGEARFRG
jgi:hypothetical protein